MYTLSRTASRLVHVEYEELPSICTIEEAIAEEAFHNPVGHSIVTGDIEKGFEASDVIVEGTMKVGGQEHFYLETNVSVCIPSEERSMKIYASTQNTAKTQHFVAKVLGLPSNKVTCHMKRMGGGFGGKETRSVFASCAAAVAANALNRPVKLALDRNVDMMTTGTRHPFIGYYKVGATSDGKLQALKLDMYSNAGYSFDLSESVMDRALFHCENAYYIPNVSVRGRCCKTNTVTNTAFRGFGGPQVSTINSHAVGVKN